MTYPIIHILNSRSVAISLKKKYGNKISAYSLYDITELCDGLACAQRCYNSVVKSSKPVIIIGFNFDELLLNPTHKFLVNRPIPLSKVNETDLDFILDVCLDGYVITRKDDVFTRVSDIIDLFVGV